MTATDNPLLTPWTAPFEMPPFAEIGPEHYRPAFDAALAEHNDEIAAIVADPAPPDFDNVIGAMERAGQLLNRVGSVFFNLVATDGDDALQEIERELTPRLAAHRQAISTNQALFAKVDAVYRQKDRLSAEQIRTVDQARPFFNDGSE